MRRVFLFFNFSLFSLMVLAQVPTITLFAPASGPIGTPVTITGTNFSATPANNIVFFGATKAFVTTATTTQLAVTVPAGATYQPISVTVAGLTAYSSKPFITTFSAVGTIDASSFAAKTDFATGANPYSVSIGDLDGDGKADLAVTSTLSNTLSIFRNTGSVGNISYAPKVDFGTGIEPISVSIGDLDGDGKADLVVANYASGSGTTASIFRNTGSAGNISYAAKVDVTTGVGSRRVTIGDLDGDGKADLAVANQSGTSVSVFRNTGSEGSISYAAKVDFATGNTPISVAIGDLDGDGKADLTVTNFNSNTVSVFRNTSTVGSISYAANVDFTTGTSPWLVSIGDLDGDGKADLAVVNGTSNTVSVFRNTGSTGNINFAPKVDFITGTQPQSVSIGDLDGDGKVDLGVANRTSNTVSVFRNTGSTGNINFAPKVDFTTGTSPRSVSIGDLDGDGKADLAVANDGSSTVSVFRNTITTSTTPSITSFTPTNAGSGNTITITGTNLTGATAVSFGGIAATSFNVVSATSILAVVGTGASGSISVTTPSGTATLTGFTFVPQPTINLINPTTAGNGTLVTLTGTNLTGATAVSFGGTAATSFNVVSTTSITAVVGSGTTGNVSVTTPGGIATLAGFTFDNLPPVVAANNTLSTVAPNSSITVSANFTDVSGIATNPAPRVFYRPIAGVAPNNFVSADMALSTGSTYTATIPSSAVSELGVEYKFLITDGVGLDNSSSQTIYKTSINHSAGLSLTSYPANAAGSAAINYRIIAFPLVLVNKSINDIFNNDLGGYDPKNWRMFKYNGSSFTELNASSVVSPGEGYWFITVSSSPLNTGPGNTVDVSTSSPFVITLKPGWNQIGNPYNFNISWADVVAANPAQSANLGGNNSKIRVFRGAIENVDVLNALEGGFVKYLGTSETSISIPVSKNLSIQGRKGSVDLTTNSLDQDAWEIFFTLRNGATDYTLGGIGMHPEAKEDFDYYDDFNSPRFIEYLEVRFPKKYAGMTYTKDVVPTTENKVWEFKVESNLKEEITSINWDNTYFGNQKKIFLLDVASHRVIDMNITSNYVFNTVKSKNFKIVFGNPDFVKQELMPTELILFEPYPNPFNNQVLIEYALPNEMEESKLEIEILNSIGTKISSAPISQKAGLGSWIWECDGLPVGLYFVRLKVGDQYKIKKLIKN